MRQSVSVRAVKNLKYTYSQAYLFTNLILVALVFFAFPSLASSSEVLNGASNLCKDSEYVKEIRWFWKKTKPIYQQWVLASDKTPYNLYNVQGETNNLLKYAEACNDRYILTELISLYLKAMDTLDETTQYAFYHYPGDKRRSVSPLDKKHRMWLDEKTLVGDETILVSAQFLSIVSETINIIAGIKYSERTQDMRKFIREYLPVLKGHYLRWVVTKPGPFQVRGWGCTVDNKYVQTGMNHKEFMYPV